jgi:predicted outer membrane lipoprotein
MMDTCQIVSGNELRRLQRYKRFALLGWAVAAVLGTSLACATGELRALQKSMVEIRKLKAEVLEVQEQQQQVNATYIKAWQLQQDTADTLISWGEFSIDKKQLIKFNKDMAVSTLIRKPNERTRRP